MAMRKVRPMPGNVRAVRGGRPPIPWHIRARRQFWYGAIRQRLIEDEVDYQLDKDFVWSKSPVERLGYSDNVEFFSAIRRNGTLTGNLQHIAKMDMTEVVNHVEADPRFAGTKEYYDASFWDRLGDEALFVKDAGRQLQAALDRYEIARVSEVPAHLRCLHPCLSESGNREIQYRWCLGLTLSERRPLEIPGLLWLLKRMTFHRRNAPFAEEIERRVDAWFDTVFRQVFDRAVFQLEDSTSVEIAALQDIRQLAIDGDGDFANDWMLGMLEHGIANNRPSVAQTFYAYMCHAIMYEQLIGQDENGWSSIEREARDLLIPQSILNGGPLRIAHTHSAMSIHAAYLFPQKPTRFTVRNR